MPNPSELERRYGDSGAYGDRPMKFSCYDSPAERATIVQGLITEKDVLAMTNDFQLANRVRAEIATAIATQVMAKLGPAIEKAIHETFANG